jgi:hypothetical protein
VQWAGLLINIWIEFSFKFEPCHFAALHFNIPTQCGHKGVWRYKNAVQDGSLMRAPNINRGFATFEILIKGAARSRAMRRCQAASTHNLLFYIYINIANLWFSDQPNTIRRAECYSISTEAAHPKKKSSVNCIFSARYS